MKQNRHSLLKSYEDDALSRQAQLAADEKRAMAQASACKKLKLRLMKLKEGWYFVHLDDSGQKQYMNQALRDKSIKAMEAKVAQCA